MELLSEGTEDFEVVSHLAAMGKHEAEPVLEEEEDNWWVEGEEKLGT